MRGELRLHRPLSIIQLVDLCRVAEHAHSRSPGGTDRAVPFHKPAEVLRDIRAKREVLQIKPRETGHGF